MTETIAIIDYGMGNLHSVAKALGKVCEQKIVVTADPAQVRAAQRVIFPGVGAIGDCMAEIRRLQFDALLTEQVASGKPVLGICVGMQALMRRSEESDGTACINLMPGEVHFFGHRHVDAQGRPLKVPHMGWNQVQHSDHCLWQDIPQHSRFYFVHSYYVHTAAADQVAGWCEYGVRFAAAVQQGNLFAVQFHPEKSHTAGLQLLRNFVRWNGAA